MNNRRSASVGALPVEKKHFVSRNESASGAMLDVRCACQYFQCESLLPERINPVESRPSSKQGYVSDMDHGASHHLDNLSARSFNLMGKSTEFDRISAASFGGRMHGMEGRGLVVRSISDATEPEMAGHMMAGHRGRKLSIGGMSSGSFGGRDADTLSIRSGISLRRISRSPSHADLFVADLNIPTAHATSHLRTEIPKLNIVAATPTPGVGKTSPPDFSTYERPRTFSNTQGRGHENKENQFAHHGAVLPQNKPIDISRYQERDEYGRIINEPMDVDTANLEAVVDIKDNIRINRMSPPLEENVPDLSPVVEDETRIEIRDIAPQPDLRPIDEILSDPNPPGHLDTLSIPGAATQRHLSSTAQQSQLKRQHGQERDLSPDYSKRQVTQRESRSLHRGAATLPRESARNQRSYSPAARDFSRNQEASAVRETRQLMQYDSLPTRASSTSRNFQRGTSPAPATDFMQGSADATKSFQRASSPTPQAAAQSFQRTSSPFSAATSQSLRASSPSPAGTSGFFQRASSPSANGRPQPQSMSTQPFMRASSPMPQSLDHKQLHRSGSPAPASMAHSLEMPSLAEKPHEEKQSYSSRFMSMFHSKPHEDSHPKESDESHSKNHEQHSFLEAPHEPKRKLSISQLLHLDRGRAGSPDRHPKPEPSPTPSRLMSVFKREKLEQPTAMQVVEGSHIGNVTIRKAPEQKPMTVKVTETFSLKVDEMDQYSSHPPKSTTPKRRSFLNASSEHLGLSQDRLSEFSDLHVNPHEAFAPIVLSPGRSGPLQLQAGDRSHYSSSSQADLRSSQGFDSHEHLPHTKHPVAFANNKKLISVPIAFPQDYDSEMTSSELFHEEPQDHPNLSQPRGRTNLVKSPSEQRLARSKLLQRKSYVADRTQSQDRAPIDDYHSELDSLSISTRSMTKNVSFSFGEQGSRHAQRDNLVASNDPLDKNVWLERTYFSRDHEYEPIGEPAKESQQPTDESQPKTALKKEPSPAPASPEAPKPAVEPTPVTAAAPLQELPKLEIQQPSPEATSDEASPSPQPDELQQAEELQREIEDRYFSSAATTPRTESQTDNEVHTSQVDSSALEELPLKPESRKKGFMASAQDRTRKMQAGLRSQAGKIKTKFRSPKKAPSGSPKAKERKRFKAPEFSKIKMPEMKRPDLSGFKRPEFTKFSKPDMSKFKLPDKFSSLKLTRSKSFKEPTEIDDTTVSGTTPDEATVQAAAAPSKKPRFDFSFGTYPRAFRKKKKPVEVESTVETSVIPSTETQPSAESSSTPQGDRGPGPVRSRWADKFSDVSYNDSEGSRYRRYGSEQESSFDRESSMERRMKEVLEENAKEEAELAMLSVVEQKEFADYDEENRVIHEISKTREREFKRRPIVHQDSDLISEEGRDVGWTQREAEKNRLLRKSELEAEEHLRFQAERMSNPDTHSTASSKKFVFEEINDDEFLLRKKGISQEFNITTQKYADPPLQDSFETSPNGMDMGGRHDSSVDRMEFGYDVPPPKPRRLSQQQRRRYYDPENTSQAEEYPDDVSFSQTGSDYMKDAPPSRPLRKGRFKHSQEISIGGTPSVQFEDDEKENITESSMGPPQAPRRRRKQLRESLEKDSYMNGFGGRSVSNSYLKEDNKPEEVIVYRTEHKYKVPLATPEKSTTTEPSVPPRKSRSLSRLGVDDDDRTSRGVDSINLELAGRGHAYNDNRDAEDEKYIIEMMENDGYAVVRKDNLPKPTPPARRKKFSRSPGERFATMPHMRKGSPAVGLEQKPYSTIGRPTPPRRKSAQSLGAGSQKDFGSADFDDYEVPEFTDRTESPRNLQSGDIINKMKYRPLPPPPRPPREKRQTPRDRHGDDEDEFDSRDDRDDRDGGGERTVFQDFHEISSDDYNQDEHMDKSVEVEVSTQTDPLPDDFVCEEFEITEDMKIIEPRRTKTLDEILKEEEEAELERARQIEEEVLLRGIQRFREANQRSASEKSRASSQAKSLSRPQTPSAILIEKRIPTPIPNANGQTVVEASLTVQPIDDLDLEEELLRREGLYDGSHSKSDADSRYQDEEGHGSEEENAMVGEEDHFHSYTDAEVHRSDEDNKAHQRLMLEQLKLEKERLELKLEKERLEKEMLEDERIVEEMLEQERLEAQRLEEERLEEERLEEERLAKQSLEEQRLEEERLLQQRLQEEEEEQRLLEELEKEQKLLEEEKKMKLLLEARERAEQLRLEEEENKRLQEQLEMQNKTLLSLQAESAKQRERLAQTEIKPRTPSPLPTEEETITSVSQSQSLADETTDLSTASPPPLAPPRKRSYAAPALDDQAESLLASEDKPATEPVPFTGIASSHLALADLEVERLRVHALQAGQIMVSHLHGGQVQAEELECRSGNLVVRNIELPPGFIEDIVERVRSTEREHTQAGTQTITEAKTQTDDDSIPPPPIPLRQSDIPPVRPPPPQRDAVFPAEFTRPAPASYLLRDPDEVPILPRSVHATEYPPIGFYRTPDDEVEPAPPVYRRRRHHRRRDSSSEEEQPRHRSRSARPETQTVAQAGRQFISACSLPLINVLNQLTNTVRPNNDNKQDQVQPRNISTVIVLFVVMTLSFLIYLLTGRNIHHHHWDYFNPPGNDGRLS